MDIELNPFHELYVTETAMPKEFVRLFSVLPVQHALLLFQQGNVVLKGTQGSGKSMLLNLLKPEIRTAFHDEGVQFPVPKKLANFIGAGMNLTRCGALDIGQRPISKKVEEEEFLFPLHFADFFNYWIIRDLLKSIDFMSKYSNVFSSRITKKNLNEFATILAKQDCWFGSLEGIRNYNKLKNKLDERLTIYKNFNQYNISQFPNEIEKTKTRIGEPISRIAKCLFVTGILTKGAQIFIRIDQYETLFGSEELRPNLGNYYRQMINKALSTRDPNISYRIGTRSYAWEEDLKIYGTDLQLEKERNYREINLDELLRRKENRQTWWFPDFASDVFSRRLMNAQYKVDNNALKLVLGKSPDPKNIVIKYSGTSDAFRALKIEASWPKIWKDFLVDLYKTEPLSAKLAQAWAMQKGSDPGTGKRLEHAPPVEGTPWNKPYWRKERIRQALMQIASSCGQRLMWWGKDNILSLSMGNILIFVSLCQHIWDAFQRSERGRPEVTKRHPIETGIAEGVQAVAIQTASEYWYKKIIEQPGGSSRQRFIDYLGRLFQQELLQDKAMSYPGHNGFSVLKDQIDEDPSVKAFLEDSVDYGDLVCMAHTTKTIDRRQRVKWYLNPVLSPYFRIPESHIKEPIYVKIEDVRKWIISAKIILEEKESLQERTPSRKIKPNKNQLSLFTKSKK